MGVCVCMGVVWGLYVSFGLLIVKGSEELEQRALKTKMKNFRKAGTLIYLMRVSNNPFRFVIH